MFLQSLQFALLFQEWKYSLVWNYSVQISLFIFGLCLTILAMTLRTTLIVIRAILWLGVIPNGMRRQLEHRMHLHPTYFNHEFVFYQMLPLLMLPLLRWH